LSTRRCAPQSRELPGRLLTVSRRAVAQSQYGNGVDAQRQQYEQQQSRGSDHDLRLTKTRAADFYRGQVGAHLQYPARSGAVMVADVIPQG
jgi:hypothetical protein